MAKLYTLNELALLVEGEVVGDGNLQVSGLNGIDLASDDEITFITNAKKGKRSFLDEGCCLYCSD